MPSYRWKSPHEWLRDAIHDGNVSIDGAICLLMESIDPDAIQDVFREEMIRDGYFHDGNEQCECGHKRCDHHKDDLYCEARVFNEAGLFFGVLRV